MRAQPGQNSKQVASEREHPCIEEHSFGIGIMVARELDEILEEPEGEDGSVHRLVNSSEHLQKSVLDLTDMSST